MNRRHCLAALLALGVVTPPLRAVADRVPKIGYLSLGPITDIPSRERQALLDGLGALGWVPGKSIDLVYRSAEGEPAFLAAMCEELLREKVDVLATAIHPAAEAHQHVVQIFPADDFPHFIIPALQFSVNAIIMHGQVFGQVNHPDLFKVVLCGKLPVKFDRTQGVQVYSC